MIEQTEEQTQKRVEKMNRILFEELNIIVRKHVHWKQGILVTLINVETSADLRHAKVFVSVLPESEQQYLMKTLEAEQQHIQNMLFQRLNRRIVPTIIFVFHKGGAQQTRVDTLLDELHKHNEEE